MNYLPLIILFALQMIALGGDVYRHGEPMDGEHNAFWSIVSISFFWFLLWWAGVFDQCQCQ